jgi:hypothetical protein
VVGDKHPLITADLRTPEGRFLEQLFAAVFERLWEAGEQQGAMEILDRYEAVGRGGAAKR